VCAASTSFCASTPSEGEAETNPLVGGGEAVDAPAVQPAQQPEGIMVAERGRAAKDAPVQPSLEETAWLAIKAAFDVMDLKRRTALSSAFASLMSRCAT
jgi:hypothetical protein